MYAYPKGFAISHGEIRLPEWLMNMDISKGAKLTYGALAICSRGKDHTWPRQELLAEKISSKVRTVQRHLDELISRGLIEKGREYVEGKIRLVYRFLGGGEGNAAAVKTDSRRRKKMSPCPPSEAQKILPPDTTNCREEGDKMSCSLNKVVNLSLIKENNPPTPLAAVPAAPADPAPEPLGKEGDFSFLELKKEEPEWIEAGEIIEGDLGENSFQTWIRPLIFERNGSGVILRAPNTFFCTWVKNNYSSQIEAALKSVGIAEWKIDVFTPEQERLAEERERRKEAERLQREREAAMAAAPADEDVDSLPLDEQFERLCNEYPKKTAQENGREEFYKLFEAKKLPKLSELLDAVRRSKKNDESWQRDDGRYVPQLKRWLFEKRWLDR